MWPFCGEIYTIRLLLGAIPNRILWWGESFSHSSDANNWLSPHQQGGINAKYLSTLLNPKPKFKHLMMTKRHTGRQLENDTKVRQVNYMYLFIWIIINTTWNWHTRWLYPFMCRLNNRWVKRTSHHSHKTHSRGITRDNTRYQSMNKIFTSEVLSRVPRKVFKCNMYNGVTDRPREAWNVHWRDPGDDHNVIFSEVR